MHMPKVTNVPTSFFSCFFSFFCQPSNETSLARQAELCLPLSGHSGERRQKVIALTIPTFPDHFLRGWMLAPERLRYQAKPPRWCALDGQLRLTEGATVYALFIHRFDLVAGLEHKRVQLVAMLTLNLSFISSSKVIAGRPARMTQHFLVQSQRRADWWQSMRGMRGTRGTRSFLEPFRLRDSAAQYTWR